MKLTLLRIWLRSPIRDLQESFRRQPIAEFEKSARRYDRVLYHIGNSPFHRQMPPLLERYPGTVVLHDFFLSHLFYYLEGVDGMALRRCLYESHGYPGLLTWARKGAEAAVWTYPCNLSVLSRAQGIIVHSEHAKQLALRMVWHIRRELGSNPTAKENTEEHMQRGCEKNSWYPVQHIPRLLFRISGAD